MQPHGLRDTRAAIFSGENQLVGGADDLFSGVAEDQLSAGVPVGDSSRMMMAKLWVLSATRLQRHCLPVNMRIVTEGGQLPQTHGLHLIFLAARAASIE